ncbi:methyltransferase [Streptomyces eurocidicus]|uniref:S-adenosyl-L-methionine-dependent methyltransferase n=1 Tax=Streptomyces eurocidicus TaxID=66423 RepID=A0A2N8P0N4_STREU|nr:SAM-dependent methyltransferase [Streptomyces eurocidicus]MBB5122059.1 methyltransferase (TIGR00027 family) [Streptomyces eurocidicus]MBF6055392.1 SAM-dependent methyltransferase [Streptomyces eurocidicus]PNE34578.1 methyltransferase [Streptomyces eurocidicus]
MEAVSYTAQWTAAARAVESERDDAMFRDPFARDLAAPRGFELLDKYGGGGLLPFIAIRTKYFDDGIGTVLRENAVEQVVLVAAGMDTRAFRLPWPAGTTVYELDHAALVDEKRARLARLDATATTDRREVRADLAEDWLPALTRAGFDPSRPTLWVAEGLMFFLTREQSAGLLRALGAASAPGSWLAVDFVSKALLRSPFSQTFLKGLKEDGTPWLFGTDEPEEFLSAAGWKVRDLKEPGEPGAGEGRWPYEVQPRDRRGVSRSWLVRAEHVGG